MEIRQNRMQLGITSHCFLLVSSLYDELMVNEDGFKNQGTTRSLRGHLYGELRSLITEAWEAEQHQWSMRELLQHLLKLAKENNEWRLKRFKYLKARQMYDKLATSPRAVGARTVEPLNNLESTEIGNPTVPANQDDGGPSA